MSENKNQAFMKGALILIIANALVKVIGAVFKIPLTYILGEEGMGLFSSSYNMYAWMFVVATAGFPVAISRMVSESRAKGNHTEVKKILRGALLLMTIIGIAGTAILYFGAGPFSDVMKNPDAKPGIAAVAPALFFVSIMSVFRGYFQGKQDMMPTAMSEVIEALGKLVAGFALAWMLMPRGLPFASAGAVSGVTVGAFLGALLLVAVYLFKCRKDNDISTYADFGPARSTGRIVIDLAKIAIPITIGASVFSLTSVIDMIMIMRRLQMSAGFSYDQAQALWGSYSGYATPLFNMPPTLITAISISIVPAITAAIAKGDVPFARRTAATAVRVTTLFALPCAVGMSVLAGPILLLVYQTKFAEQSLTLLALAIVFVSLVMVTNAMLQAVGKENIPVRNMIIGGAIKIIVNYTLVGMPAININGAPIGSNLCYITILILNIFSIKKEIGVKFGIVQSVVKPVLSAAVMAVTALAVYNYTAFLGNSMATIVAIAAAAAVYLAMLFILGAITREDMEMLPKSEKILPLMQKLKLIRR